jgi:hypothetical protein
MDLPIGDFEAVGSTGCPRGRKSSGLLRTGDGEHSQRA